MPFISPLPRQASFYFFFLAGAFSFSNLIFASSEEEYKVKAALLYNIAQFTRWPENTSEPGLKYFQLCILEQQSVGNTFSSIENKHVNQCPLRVRKVQDLFTLRECQIVFVSGTERHQLLPFFAAVQDKPILTIGEMAGFAEAGGMINILKKNNTLHFEINLQAVQHADLHISSRLLKLATIVK